MNTFKWIGLVFIAVGLSLLLFAVYIFFTKTDQTVSPIPEEQGVKVIYITPSPQ